MLVFSYGGDGITLVDFHIRRCHSIERGTGGIKITDGAPAQFTMIRGSISDCSGREAGAVQLRQGFNSFTDVLVTHCHTLGTEPITTSMGDTLPITAGGI